MLKDGLEMTNYIILINCFNHLLNFDDIICINDLCFKRLTHPPLIAAIFGLNEKQNPDYTQALADITHHYCQSTYLFGNKPNNINKGYAGDYKNWVNHSPRSHLVKNKNLEIILINQKVDPFQIDPSTSISSKSKRDTVIISDFSIQEDLFFYAIYHQAAIVTYIDSNNLISTSLPEDIYTNLPIPSQAISFLPYNFIQPPF